MKSPFDTFGVATWAPGDSGNINSLGALAALAVRLASVSATSADVSAARDAISSRGYSVWAAPTAPRAAELLQGTTNSVSAGQFRYRASGPLGDRAFKPLSGSGTLDGLPWMSMAFWDGTSFRGILVWAWTGNTCDGSLQTTGTRAVTDPASVFSPTTGDGSYRQFRAVVINSAGQQTVTGTVSGYQFSSAQNPTANGYYTTGQFSQDDGVWGFTPGGAVDGDTPGASLGSGSYGFNNYNGSEPIFEYYWGGTAQASSNFVGVVFSA